MTAPRCGGRESFLEIKRRAQSGAGTSGRAQSEHAQIKMGHVRRTRGESKEELPTKRGSLGQDTAIAKMTYREKKLGEGQLSL